MKTISVIDRFKSSWGKSATLAGKHRVSLGGSTILLASVMACAWSTKTLSVHIGKPYELVIKDSTFPVEDKTAIYPGDPNDPEDPARPGSTWISSPTIIEFDDPVYGFKLPSTVFGAVTYASQKVSTLTTSPMTETLPFSEALERLVATQSNLKSRGWKLEPLEHNDWFNADSGPERERLKTKLFDQAVGIDLYVPGKYSLLLLIKCYASCDKQDPATAKYLIDISVGRDRSGT
ncbi:hypothetical protein ACTZGP_12140 [Pseudomonas putida]|uniref:hypothetical protein n=1 Tax=Pseudomonas TaxID=286 RepID=UPI00209ABCAE|nr:MULTISPECIES: hypothetical protein [Pseudomonas]MCO7630108.1 hypothetical protein [Pseudomonas fluorescens]